MARTVRTKVYKFSELSEIAKAKAIIENESINVDNDWWGSVYDDARNVGIKIESFDLYRQQIEGSFIVSAYFTANKIIADHGETCDTAKTSVRYWDQLNAEEVSEDIEHEFLTDILDDYLKMLQNESDYLHSAKAIAEALISSDYEFTQDGRRF